MNTHIPVDPDLRPSPRLLFVWRMLLELQIVSAAAWLWLMPRGFPIGHSRFLINQVLPSIAIAVLGACLYLERCQHWQQLANLAIGPVLFGVVAAAVGTALFPRSAPKFLVIALPFLILEVVVYWLAFRSIRWCAGTAAPIALVAAVLGTFTIWFEQAEKPDTRPLNSPVPDLGHSTIEQPTDSIIGLGEHAHLQVAEGRIQLVGRLKIDIAPLLTFESRSPDRFWTVFSRQRDRNGPGRICTGMQHDADAAILKYRDDGETWMKVTTNRDGTDIAVDVSSRIDHAIYSHLNSFTQIDVHGHHRLLISFSPCPDVRIEVMPSDYPIGRPVRLAYLDSADIFHVVEAHSGEKGPFMEFGRGTLRRSDSLTISLHDDEIVRAEIVLDDWASQTGRALSPTAGWGLPVNAIEFSRLGQSPDSTASIWMTLAATSVGRGWDSVGHSAGVYRNRLSIRLYDSP